jgi:hypothetical protein
MEIDVSDATWTLLFVLPTVAASVVLGRRCCCRSLASLSCRRRHHHCRCRVVAVLLFDGAGEHDASARGNHASEIEISDTIADNKTDGDSDDSGQSTTIDDDNNNNNNDDNGR